MVYLSNAIQKYCTEQGFEHSGIWQKWAAYGFDSDGIQRIEEYYPDALMDTYKGVRGYIYFAETVEDSGFQTQIPGAVTSEKPVVVSGCEYVEDAYDEAVAAAEEVHPWYVNEYKSFANDLVYDYDLEDKFVGADGIGFNTAGLYDGISLGVRYLF